jgi:hypothetical protein
MREAQQSRQFLRPDLTLTFVAAIAERHCVRVLLQTLAPQRKAIAVPIQNLDPIPPPAGEHKTGKFSFRLPLLQSPPLIIGLPRFLI